MLLYWIYDFETGEDFFVKAPNKYDALFTASYYGYETPRFCTVLTDLNKTAEYPFKVYDYSKIE